LLEWEQGISLSSSPGEDAPAARLPITPVAPGEVFTEPLIDPAVTVVIFEPGRYQFHEEEHADTEHDGPEYGTYAHELFGITQEEFFTE
jgi:hypothetical protein